MAFNILSWNVELNQDWYVKLSDSGSDILIELFESLADATAGTNLQASGSTGSYGTNYAVLTMESGVDNIGFFQEAYNWHLCVTGSSGDPTIIKKVSKFVEASPISDAIYKNEDLIVARGISEIRKSTCAIYDNKIVVASNDDLEVGQIVTIDSDRISSELVQLSTITIQGDKDSLLFDLGLVEYKEIQKA